MTIFKIVYSLIKYLRAATLSGLAIVSINLPSSAEPKLNLGSEARDKIEQRFSNTEISSVSCDNFGTLCQVVSGKSVFYVNPNATHAFIGRVFDLESNQDLTEVTIDRLEASNNQTDHKPFSWVSLPVHDAIIRNKNGIYEVAVISDINCGFCKKFSSQIDQIPDIKVYEFLLGNGSSKEKSNQIVCSETPEQALQAYYANKQFLSPDCDRDITASANKIAEQIDLKGTPTFIRPDGEILVGFESIHTLRNWITETQ